MPFGSELSLYSDYDRQSVQEIFEPEATFTPGAGKWGLSGAIELLDQPGSFVFFVSFGRSQGEHEFDEGISGSGILRWQSQPAQDLSDRRILSWISHDPDVNAVHLFLRTSLRHDGSPTPFTYLGELEYAGHDPDRERPVYFSWRLRNWPIPRDVLGRIRLDLEDKEPLEWEVSKQQPATSTQTAWQLTTAQPPDIPSDGSTKAPGGRRFTPRLDINFERKSAQARKLGELGEKLVVSAEERRLTECGRKDLADKVVHVAKERGDGAGYDVLSFTEEGQEIFIEVKTTTLGPQTDFLITANELAFSSEYSDQYRLYRLYHFDEATMTAEMYALEGDLLAQLPLLPTEYRATGFKASKARSDQAG